MPSLPRPKPEIPPPGLHGVVATPPAKPGAPFTVVVPSYDLNLIFDIERWQSRGVTLPAAGDECLLVEDNAGEPWVAAWWPTGGDAPPGTGPEGKPGSVWYSGAGVPEAGLGANNDFYLRTSNGDIYRKEAGSWKLVGNIRGPEGPEGKQGIEGKQGVEGKAGPTGPAGALPWTSVATYGAKGDGVTDDSAAIQAAMDALKVSGGTVIFGPGVFLVKTTLKIPSGVHLIGAGTFATTLKLAKEANTNLVSTVNYGTGGSTDFSVWRMTLDGNNAQNSIGHCLALEGLRFILDSLNIHHAAEDNLHVPNSSLTAKDEDAVGGYESTANNLKLYLAGGKNLWWDANDGCLFDIQCIAKDAGSKKTNIEIGENAGILQATSVHAWGQCKYAWVMKGTGIFLGCQGEGGVTANVLLEADSNQFIGGKYFRDGSGHGEVGFEWAAGKGHNTIIDGVRVKECEAGAFKFTGNGEGSRIRAVVQTGEGKKAIVGEPDATVLANSEIYVFGGGTPGAATRVKRRAPAAAEILFDLGQEGDAKARFLIEGSGAMSWGGGTETQDTFLQRAAAKILKVIGGFKTSEKLTVEAGGLEVEAGEAKFDGTLKHTGSKAGYFGATAVEKPKVTGVKGRAAVTTLLAKLAELGLVTDESTAPGEEVASANTITVKDGAALVEITGTTEIKKIAATSKGHLLTLKFASALTVKNGENLKLKADFAATAGATLSLICDGTNWYPVDDEQMLGPTASTDGDLASFSGTSGKLLKDSGLSLDTDGTLAANSDSRIASQKATKTYIATETGLLIPKSLVDAKGDLIAATADNTVARLAVGANGTELVADSSETTGLRWGANRLRSVEAWKPTVAVAENLPRWAVEMGSMTTLTSGTLYLVGGLILPAHVAVSEITFFAGSTALETGSNQWFCLVDQSRKVLRKTADDTSKAWAANGEKKLVLSSSYTPVVDEAVYVGIMVKATKVPTLRGRLLTGLSAVSFAPIFAGNSTTALTTPASLGETAAALTEKEQLPYCIVN